MSGIECPDCQARLVNEDFLEVDVPGKEGSIYTYQWWGCPECDLFLYAVLEEFRGAGDDDLVHKGYRVEDKEKYNETLVAAAMCPDQHDRKCTCALHKELRDGGFPGKGDFVPMNLKTDR